jgi:hypothetical protein
MKVRQYGSGSLIVAQHLITQERIRRSAFTSVIDLESAIMDYLGRHNADPKPFVWAASASAILEKVACTKQAYSHNTKAC